MLKLKAPHETEAGFTRAVISLAQLHGWRVAHFRPAMRRDGSWRTAVQGDGAGFPDLVLARNDVVIVAELKVGKGKLTPAQAEWLRLFALAGIPAYTWRPAAWGEIEGVLS